MNQESINCLREFSGKNNLESESINQAIENLLVAQDQTTWNAFQSLCYTTFSETFRYEKKQGDPLKVLFAELFRDPNCRAWMIEKKQFSGKVHFYNTFNTVEIDSNGVRDPNTERQGVFITNYFVRKHIIHQLNAEISTLQNYLETIGSHEAKSDFEASDNNTLIADMQRGLRSLFDGGFVENFISTGNLTYLQEYYQALSEKYQKPEHRKHLQSYGEFAYYHLCTALRGIGRIIDYFVTLVTTGQFEAGYLNQPNYQPTISLPEAHASQQLRFFVNRVNDLLKEDEFGKVPNVYNND